MKRSNAHDLLVLGETVLVVIATWLVLRWPLDRAISQADASVQWIPYLRDQLATGPDWTDHLYRFGVIGGAKLHDAAGTLPLVQVCAVLGLSATTTANLITIYLQVCFAFFGIKAIEARSRPLRAPERIVGVWLCSFAPILSWRLALGHENLVFGILPWIAALSLAWSARANRLTHVQLLFAAFATWNGLSVLGYQMIVYAAVFASPFAICAALDLPKARPATYLIAGGALLAGVLLVLPRLAGMMNHAFGEDFARSGSGSLVYSLGTQPGSAWLSSLPWSGPDIARYSGTNAHELNYPLGALVVPMLALARRRTAIAWLLGLALAVCFASNIDGISRTLRTVIPPLDAFRSPARSVIPLLVVVPWMGYAQLVRNVDVEPKLSWLAVAMGLATLLVSPVIPPILRELLTWFLCIGLAGAMRWKPTVLRPSTTAIALAVVAAFGVRAFSDRVPREAPHGDIEQGPRQLRESVLAQAPEVAMPLNRLEVRDPAPPFGMSMAFAAGLPSLDGVWYPPRRFLQLIEALAGHSISRATGVFQLTKFSQYARLQQLYNVKYIVSLRDGVLAEEPETRGPAWFVERVDILDTPSQMQTADVSTVGWLSGADIQMLSAGDRACRNARVVDVEIDHRGQVATFHVADVKRPCLLVIATNYVSTLRASTDSRPTRIVPTDIALVGVLVPAGAKTIVLGPVATIPWWTRLASLLGIVILGISLVGASRASVGLRRATGDRKAMLPDEASPR